MLRVRPAMVMVCVSGLLLAGCGGGEAGGDQTDPPPADPPAGAASPATEAPDQAAPEPEVPEVLAFTAPTVDGDELDAATLAGTPVAFWFWAAWCSRCAAAASDVKAASEEFAGQVQLVGVAGLGSGADSMQEFVARHELDGFPHLADDEGQVWQRFGVTTQEYFVVLDASGEVVHDGPLGGGDLRDQLAALES